MRNQAENLRTPKTRNEGKRHYCKICGSKKTVSGMMRLQFAIVDKTAWVCRECTSTNLDVLRPAIVGRKPQFLELFSGSGHISKVAEKCGYKTFTVDIESKFNPDYCIDILNVRRTKLPKYVDVVWVSIPCTVYSTMSLAYHWDRHKIGDRRYYYAPKTPDAINALMILDRVIRLIKEIKPIYFFIENPRGALRHMSHFAFVPFRHTVSYLDYGFEFYKPTDIWTNCNFFQPKPCPNYNNIPAHKNLRDDTESKYQRSLVPDGLIYYLFQSINYLNPAYQVFDFVSGHVDVKSGDLLV